MLNKLFLKPNKLNTTKVKALPIAPINHRWGISYNPNDYYRPVNIYSFGEVFLPFPNEALPRWVKSLVDKLILDHAREAKK